MNKLSHSQRGASAVEFAIVLPILMLIIFAIVNFGIVMSNQAIITNAAREGARWASVHTTSSYGTGCSATYSATPTDPCQAAFSYANNLLISFGIGPELSVTNPTPSDYNSGTPQTVTVSYDYYGIGYFFSSFFSDKTYTATSVMLHE